MIRLYKDILLALVLMFAVFVSMLIVYNGITFETKVKVGKTKVFHIQYQSNSLNKYLK